VDTIVDRFFPMLEEISQRLETVDEAVLLHPDRESLQSVHRIKRDLARLRLFTPGFCHFGPILALGCAVSV
jgi:magnesium transporter